MNNKISKFTSELLSIDESRKSIVVIVLMIMTGFAIYKSIALGLGGDIPNNFMTIILTLSGLVFGNNAISNVANIITASKNKTYNIQNNQNDVNNQFFKQDYDGNGI